MKIATTIGDPSGIGPEVIVKSIRYFLENSEILPIVIGDSKTVSEMLKINKLQIETRIVDSVKNISPNKKTVFIFDDIHLSEEMEEAWKEIKKHPKVQVTIDTFYLGLVFFRREQAKQDFKIRL